MNRVKLAKMTLESGRELEEDNQINHSKIVRGIEVKLN